MNKFVHFRYNQSSEALDRMIFAICTDYGIEEGVDSDYAPGEYESEDDEDEEDEEDENDSCNG